MTIPGSDPVALLLAAGEGSRLGADKPFVDVGGRPLIYRALRPYRKAKRVQDVILVVPKGTRERFEPYRNVRIHIVENPNPEGGMISSIRAGLNCTWAHERNFMIAPADIPYVDPEYVDRIAAAFATRGCKILIPTYKGLGGHPGVFSGNLREDFFLHGDNVGAREIILRYQVDTVRLHIHEPDVCFDIDTPEDLAIATDASARWARVEAEVEAKKKARLGKST